MRLITLSVLRRVADREPGFDQIIDLDDPTDPIARSLCARENIVEVTRALVKMQDAVDADGIETIAWAAAEHIAAARVHLDAVEARFRLEHATAEAMRARR